MDQDDDVNRLRIALRSISRMFDRQVAGDGMTGTQMSVLGSVVRSRSLRMSELAEREGLNPTMLSRIVGKLETAGLVCRTTGDNDRRAVVVEPTPDGSRLHARLRRQRTKLLAERLDRLPAEHVESLLAAVPALELLADAMRPGEHATGLAASSR